MPKRHKDGDIRHKNAQSLGLSRDSSQIVLSAPISTFQVSTTVFSERGQHLPCRSSGFRTHQHHFRLFRGIFNKPHNLADRLAACERGGTALQQRCAEYLLRRALWTRRVSICRTTVRLMPYLRSFQPVESWLHDILLAAHMSFESPALGGVRCG